MKEQPQREKSGPTAGKDKRTDQEKEADLKRSNREKALMDVRTFALTTDVSETHRQVPIATEDWHLSRMSGITWRSRTCPCGGSMWGGIGVLLLVWSCFFSGQVSTVHCSRDDPSTSRRREVRSNIAGCHCVVIHVWSSPSMEQDGGRRYSRLGRPPVVARNTRVGYLSSKSRVVHSLVTRCRMFRVHPHVQF